MLRYSVAFDKIAHIISPYFQSRRMNIFLAEFSPAEQTTIIDVGGSPAFWRNSPVKSKITVVNTHVPTLKTSDRDGFELIVGDARSLPFEDNTFDIGFSNSVIEHLFTREDQRLAAREIQRVSKHIWVQTPARWFPIETHLKTPLVHYLPVSVQRRLIRNFTVWGWLSRPQKEDVDLFLSEIKLLTYKDMKSMFADCKIFKEHFMLMTKSYVAIK
ncbi:MAG TPA: methyltransferase domain-containing protein [Blastocatellia bacterium]|nr:methyltransferase domain-containing protein [Blastocatellia bacterium]